MVKYGVPWRTDEPRRYTNAQGVLLPGRIRCATGRRASAQIHWWFSPPAIALAHLGRTIEYRIPRHLHPLQRPIERYGLGRAGWSQPGGGAQDQQQNSSPALPRDRLRWSRSTGSNFRTRRCKRSGIRSPAASRQGGATKISDDTWG